MSLLADAGKGAARKERERWLTIASNGERTDHAVPAEMMVYGPDDDREAVKAAHRAASAEHGKAVTAAGMGFDDGPSATEDIAGHLGPDDRLLWKLDGGHWQARALPARPA
jgi:hypothetical protein